MSFADRLDGVKPCNPADYRPFHVAGTRVGMMTPEFADRLAAFGDVFRVTAERVALDPRLGDADARTRAVDPVLRALDAEGWFTGWHDEPYPVGTGFHTPPLMTMERAAVPLFGIRAYGVHMNGYVRENGRIARMWIGRRSRFKPTGPGKLDQIVAGGQPAGVSLRDNLIKECGEEASIPAAIAADAIAVGGISYCTHRPEGIRNDVLFNYDLELPADFVPENTDGEIEDFYLWDIERVMSHVNDTDEFKFNCGLVVVDFLMRHGFIDADHPDYEALLLGMRR